MEQLAIVTGGTRGIGREISIALKNSGYTVAATCRTKKDETIKFSEETGIGVFDWDVSDFEQCAAGVANIEATYDQKAAILVNNAGIIADRMFHKMDYITWNNVIQNNLTSVFNMCKACISSMRDMRYGRIINVSSVNALSGQLGQTNYSAAKAGIIGFTKSLALESAMVGVTVNAIAPGYVETQMTSGIKEEIKEQILKTIPIKRFAKPEEIAKAVLFIIDQAYMTGETININGGMYMQ